MKFSLIVSLIQPFCDYDQICGQAISEENLIYTAVSTQYYASNKREKSDFLL
jgi:hypothetical protein